MRVLGFILIVVGIIMILIRGFNVPVKKNVVDLGPIEISKTENKWIGWPTYAGGLMTVIGVFLVITDKKK
jgi:drug/metabolite transporter (DMT)-like permease